MASWNQTQDLIFANAVVTEIFPKLPECCSLYLLGQNWITWLAHAAKEAGKAEAGLPRPWALVRGLGMIISQHGTFLLLNWLCEDGQEDHNLICSSQGQHGVQCAFGEEF